MATDRPPVKKHPHRHLPNDIAYEIARQISKLSLKGKGMQDSKKFLRGVVDLIILDANGGTRLFEDTEGKTIEDLFAKFEQTISRNLRLNHNKKGNPVKSLESYLQNRVKYEWIDASIDPSLLGRTTPAGCVNNPGTQIKVQISAQIDRMKKGTPNKSAGLCTVEMCAHEFVHALIFAICCNGNCDLLPFCDGRHELQLGTGFHGPAWEAVARALEAKLQEIDPAFSLHIDQAINQDRAAGRLP